MRTWESGPMQRLWDKRESSWGWDIILEIRSSLDRQQINVNSCKKRPQKTQPLKLSTHCTFFNFIHQIFPFNLIYIYSYAWLLFLSLSSHTQSPFSLPLSLLICVLLWEAEAASMIWSIFFQNLLIFLSFRSVRALGLIN